MDVYEISFELILHAGDAKSKCLMAIESAREEEFEESEQYMAEATESMKLAHKCQMDLIQSEAKGEKVEITVLLVHAQDHLAMALSALDHAKELIEMHKKFFELSNQVKQLIKN
ncbi:PTS lactose/cellobiose transporter subunit IIA [Streptococcus merionis]|uniref:Lactose/cellobiose-specific phosphotransferase system (PTS), IIA component n=1 Tax=Streptococcus merionis TaxID=400065 RepID=A0A239SYG7_9STRE|nr:PTS lactose/cellobiose transporter subunit IIA [Streptococcus merionis]SNU89754.1 lactose/cellobiose-specific phosphotransferase system (PTS), IIA component [Streptococcus merionis]